jgi:hypothetical protein
MCRHLRKSSPVSQASTGVVEMNIFGHANRLLSCSRVWGSNCELKCASSTGVAPLGWTVRTAPLFQMHFGPSGKSLLKPSWRAYFSVEPQDSLTGVSQVPDRIPFGRCSCAYQGSTFRCDNLSNLTGTGSQRLCTK